jgi:hypothetical protein
VEQCGGVTRQLKVILLTFVDRAFISITVDESFKTKSESVLIEEVYLTSEILNTIGN